MRFVYFKKETDCWLEYIYMLYIFKGKMNCGLYILKRKQIAGRNIYMLYIFKRKMKCGL